MEEVTPLDTAKVGINLLYTTGLEITDLTVTLSISHACFKRESFPKRCISIQTRKQSFKLSFAPHIFCHEKTAGYTKQQETRNNRKPCTLSVTSSCHSYRVPVFSERHAGHIQRVLYHRACFRHLVAIIFVASLSMLRTSHIPLKGL